MLVTVCISTFATGGMDELTNDILPTWESGQSPLTDLTIDLTRGRRLTKSSKQTSPCCQGRVKVYFNKCAIIVGF